MTKKGMEISRISSQFAIDGTFVGGKEIVSGLINVTYLAEYVNDDGERSRYVLQRINEQVFPDPHSVMRNISKVTKHINRKVFRRKRDFGGQTLNLYPGRDGKDFVEGPEGGVWRCYNYIEGCCNYDIVENTRQAYQAAKAFGAFQDLISDLSPSEISITIPDFHNTPSRYGKLMKAIKEDRFDRVKLVTEEIDFINNREEIVHVLLDHLKKGGLKERITHNDTKLNNVLLHKSSGEGMCVVDLDTVMPGCALHDFGDLVRTAACSALEDEVDLEKVRFQPEVFGAIVEGYLEAAGDMLEQSEIEHLALAPQVITYELGLRFLADYLDGDLYFKVKRPGHNLDRSRAQFKLLSSMEEHFGEMVDIVRECSSPKAFA